MGLLDGLISSVIGSAMGGGGAGAQQGSSPLGGLLSSLAGGQSGGSGGLLAAAMSMVQGQGGVSGLVAKLTQGGLGAHAGSWVGAGPNMPVSGDQLNQALGPNAMSAVATQLGVPPAQASSTMAQILPALINHLTPNGQVPADEHSMLADGLKMLQGLTRS